MAISTAAGSPGPFDTKSPSGRSRAISSAGVSAGTTVTWQPRSDRSRGEFAFTPRS